MNIFTKLTLTILLGTGYIATTQRAVTGQDDVKLKGPTLSTVEGSTVNGKLH